MRPNKIAFMGKIKGKEYPQAVWNSMTKEQQVQVHKLHQQQGINSIAKQTSKDAKINALEAKLGINSQPKEGDIKKKGGEAPKEPS